MIMLAITLAVQNLVKLCSVHMGFQYDYVKYNDVVTRPTCTFPFLSFPFVSFSFYSTMHVVQSAVLPSYVVCRSVRPSIRVVLE